MSNTNYKYSLDLSGLLLSTIVKKDDPNQVIQSGDLCKVLESYRGHKASHVKVWSCREVGPALGWKGPPETTMWVLAPDDILVFILADTTTSPKNPYLVFLHQGEFVMVKHIAIRDTRFKSKKRDKAK